MTHEGMECFAFRQKVQQAHFSCQRNQQAVIGTLHALASCNWTAAQRVLTELKGTCNFRFKKYQKKSTFASSKCLKEN
jgi:hypothetical protein